MWTKGRALRYSALALAPLMVLGGLALGPRIGALGLVSGLPAGDPLDYASRPPQSLSPLDARYVSSVLGLAATAPSGPFGSARPDGGAVTGPAFAAPVVDVHPLTNDDIGHARSVPSVPYTAKVDTTRATRSSSDPSECGPVGGTVWYRYRPGRNLGLLADTFGTNYSTALAVYSGTPAHLTLLGCSTNAQGNSVVPFPARNEGSYYFGIAGPAGGGHLVFHLAPEGTTTVVGAGGNPTISGDGRFVAFESAVNDTTGTPNPASPGCESGCTQIFVRDLARKTTTLVSADPSGRLGNGRSYWASMSYDGRHVAFASDSSNLVPGDTNNFTDVFVRDLDTRRTERVSVASSGAQTPFDPNNQNGAFDTGPKPSISADGNRVAFATRAALVGDDHNGDWDVYVRDRRAHTTERVSVSYTGGDPSNDSGTCATCPATQDLLNPAISPNGRYVKFTTGSTNIVRGQKIYAPGNYDAFVRDLATHTTEQLAMRVPHRACCAAVNNEFGPRQAFSYDGRWVVFSASIDNPNAQPTTRILAVDRLTHRVFMASVSSAGAEPKDGTEERAAGISGDGRYVVFNSDASNLSEGDTNGLTDVFVHDLQTRTTIRVSVSDTGDPRTDGSSTYPNISSDGRRVVYYTQSAEVGPAATVGVGVNDTVYVFDRPLPGR